MCRNSMTLVPSCVHSMFVIPAPCGPMTKMARWKRLMVSSTPAEPSKTTNSRSVRGNKRKMLQYKYTEKKIDHRGRTGLGKQSTHGVDDEPLVRHIAGPRPFARCVDHQIPRTLQIGRA